MDSRDERPYWSSDGQPCLRRYVLQAMKGVLCVSGWVGIFALLLAHGPPAMSMTNGAPYPFSIITGIFAVLLSAGTATLFTIILGVFVLGAIGWNRNRSSGTPDETETTEDETHA
jgi:membrane glycosyltransferase